MNPGHNRTLRRLAAIASGLILSFAYPRWNLSFLVGLWMLPLLWSLWNRADDPGKKQPRPFWLGCLAGLAFFIPNLWWVRHSSRVIHGAVDHSWAGFGPELLGLAAVAGLAGYCAVYFGLWAWFAARFAKPRDERCFSPNTIVSSLDSLRCAFLGGAFWCGCEWLRGLVFTGFGWNGLGVALHQQTRLIQIADVIGVSGLSFVIVFVSIVLFLVARRMRHGYREGRRHRLQLDLIAAALLIAFTVIYGISRERQSDGDAIPLKAAMIQGHVPQAVKWSGEQAPEIYQRYADLTRLHAGARDGESPVDLVIWPEGALPIPLLANPEIAADHERYFNSILSLGGFSLLTGCELPAPNRRMFTSASLFRGSFASRQHYHKVHLVPFGEFLPFRDTFPFSLLARVLPGDFVRGPATEPLNLEQPSLQIIPLICFEDTVGRVARRFVRDEPQVIVNLTNDGWFLQSAEPEMHLANAVFRCIELRRPMVRAANTGVTCSIDTRGRIGPGDRLEDPATGSTFIEGVLQKEIAVPKNPPRTVYARFGDAFSVSCLVLAGLAAVLRTVRGTRTATD